MIRIVSWNVAQRIQPVAELLEMDADVALLQEVGPGTLEQLASAGGNVELSPQDPWEPWPREHYGFWPAVVKLSDRVDVEWFRQVLPSTPQEANDEIAVSNVGIIAAARVIPRGAGEPFIAFSMYARWFRPHRVAGSSYIYSDAAAHHIMSDLSAFIGDTNPGSHRILAAGDMNNVHGVTEDNPLAWYRRDIGVFARIDALGLELVGPQYPDGRLADPPPRGVQEGTRNTPTYHTARGSPATAENQLDYVFASRGFHRCVRARAMNGVEEWGSSDHCRILIEVDA